MTLITMLNFDKGGHLQGPFQPPDDSTTDVVFVVHGWHEDQVSAQTDYGKLLGPLDDILAANPERWIGRKVAYYGVIWPSDEYNDDLTAIDMRPDVGGPPPATLTPSTAALALPDADLTARARQVATLIGTDPDVLAEQALAAAKDPARQGAFLATLQTATSARPVDPNDTEANIALQGFNNPVGSIFSTIGNALHNLATSAGSVLSDNPLIGWLKHLRQDANAVVAHILNTFAYNELKIRAGVIGAGLASDVLNGLDSALKVHLVGHSFGARVMTSAANATTHSVANLTMLEGAFSHNALSEDPIGPIDGAYRPLMLPTQKVTGRIAAVCSENDTAVWIAYPLASRVFHDSTSLLPSLVPTGLIFGGPTDRYGAIGANGPQNLAGVNTWRFTGDSLPGLAKGVHTLQCGSFVGAHTDVWKAGCAYVIAAGLLL